MEGQVVGHGFQFQVPVEKHYYEGVIPGAPSGETSKRSGGGRKPRVEIQGAPELCVFSCDKCTNTYATQANLARHMKLAHSGIKQERPKSINSAAKVATAAPSVVAQPTLPPVKQTRVSTSAAAALAAANNNGPPIARLGVEHAKFVRAFLDANGLPQDGDAANLLARAILTSDMNTINAVQNQIAVAGRNMQAAKAVAAQQQAAQRAAAIQSNASAFQNVYSPPVIPLPTQLPQVIPKYIPGLVCDFCQFSQFLSKHEHRQHEAECFKVYQSKLPVLKTPHDQTREFWCSVCHCFFENSDELNHHLFTLHWD